jgi:hypothetical protein
MDKIFKLLALYQVVKAMQACNTLLRMHKRIEHLPNSKRHRQLQKDSYKFITEHLGPLEQYAVFHPAKGAQGNELGHFFIYEMTNIRKLQCLHCFLWLVFGIHIFLIGLAWYVVATETSTGSKVVALIALITTQFKL